jgi:tetratricopeptide (TPR) repeat protein
VVQILCHLSLYPAMGCHSLMQAHTAQDEEYRMRKAWMVALLGTCSAAVHAGDVPLYQPAPAWIVPAQLDLTKVDESSPSLLIRDQQLSFEGGRQWIYSDTATRAATPEMLGQLATITLPWMPDKGDIIFHELSIIRPGQTIDLLARNEKFTVLRREQGLEQRQLTGILSATMPISGLQVGDVLRLRYSVTNADAALGGNVQSSSLLVASPMRLGFGRMRLRWADKEPLRWRVLGETPAIKPVRSGGFNELLVPLPLAKQPEMPKDAPVRFQRPPLIEATSFADWQAVSKVMAPLYDTPSAIAPGDPLAEPLARVKAEATPLARTQRALQIVQDDIRYLLLGMEGGNYVPQKPTETWSKRFGDCKAKTLLLLALLRGAGIEAEAVLVHSKLGDLLPERLPSVLAFDHVIVKATVEGETLWLDGTGRGARIEDIRDVPFFRYALPVRREGATLMAMPARPPQRPVIELFVDADESTSTDLPSPIRATAVLRGPIGLQLALGAAQVDSRQRDELIVRFFNTLLGTGQYADVSLKTDAALAVTTLEAKGVVNAAWRWEDKRMERAVSRALANVAFNPDRSRTAWAGIPVATPPLDVLRLRFQLRIKLPQSGRDFMIEGTADSSEQVAGRVVTRKTTLVDGVATIDEGVGSNGAEILAADIPAERDKLARLRSTVPKLVAPRTLARRWELTEAQLAAGTQLAAVEAVFAKSIANARPGDVSALISRSRLRAQIGNRAGAISDLTAAIAINAHAKTYASRARLYSDLGRLKDAVADAEKARSLDPASGQINGLAAGLLAETGQLPRALALLDERISMGGQSRLEYQRRKADVLGEFGDAQEALTLLDGLIAEKPGNPALLNARCWVKGTRSVALETALKDCTSAIELSSTTANALDSRALVWLRLGRLEEALQDLHAVLAEAPGKAESRFLRGIVLTRLDRRDEAAKDFAIARRLSPRIDDQYARYGLKP